MAYLFWNGCIYQKAKDNMWQRACLSDDSHPLNLPITKHVREGHPFREDPGEQLIKQLSRLNHGSEAGQLQLLELATNRCPTEPIIMFNSLFYIDQKLVLRSDLLKPQSRTELVLKLKYKPAPPLGLALSCNPR